MGALNLPLGARLGLGIGRDTVRGVLVRRGTVSWMLELERAPSEPLAVSIARLAAAAPIGRWARPRVTVALGPSLAQTKRLTDLPPIVDARLISGLVAEGSARFFLRNGVALVTSGVRVTAPGEGWAAALDQPVASEIAAACRAARLRLRSIVPSVAVLPLALAQEGTFSWRDGELTAELVVERGQLRSARRVIAGEADVDAAALPVVAALRKRGPDAWRFADAYGAALVGPREPLAVRGGSAGAVLGQTPPRWRVALASVALAAAVAIAFIAPAIAAGRAERRARAELLRVAAQRRAAALVEGELRLTTGALTDLAQFDAGRRSLTMLMAGLTRALPGECALVAFRSDSAAGSVVALAPRAAAVLTAMEQVAGVVGPEIFGPVTREVVKGKELERVTVRFRLAGLRGPRVASAGAASGRVVRAARTASAGAERP